MQLQLIVDVDLESLQPLNDFSDSIIIFIVKLLINRYGYHQGLREGGSGGTSYPGPGSRGPKEFRFLR